MFIRSYLIWLATIKLDSPRNQGLAGTLNKLWKLRQIFLASIRHFLADTIHQAHLNEAMQLVLRPCNGG